MSSLQSHPLWLTLYVYTRQVNPGSDHATKLQNNPCGKFPLMLKSLH